MKPEHDWIEGVIKSFGHFDKDKGEYFIDPRTQSWVTEAMDRAASNRRHLKRSGFAGHDLKGLAEAKPLDAPPPESGVSKSGHEEDPRPRAEIVAAAKAILLFEDLRSAYESRDFYGALDYAYKLAEANLKSESLFPKNNEDRNRKLCQTAEELGADHRRLTKLTFDTWHSRGLWKKYGYKELTTCKQVRNILRKGGVLPPAKTRKGK